MVSGAGHFRKRRPRKVTGTAEGAMINQECSEGMRAFLIPELRFFALGMFLNFFKLRNTGKRYHWPDTVEVIDETA